MFIIPVAVVNSEVATQSQTTYTQLNQCKTTITVSSGTEFQNAFINRVSNAALQDNSGIFHSITIAQAILESNWGESTLTSKYNNLFGIKGSFNGSSVNMLTGEFFGGAWVTINADFRSYNNYEESIKDHSNFLLENSRYKLSGVFDATNYIEQANALQKAGYATDPTYAKKLISIIKTFGLDIFDNYINEDIQFATTYVDFDKLMKTALEQEGKRYKMQPVPDIGSDGVPINFDCSSLVQYCFRSIGINLPRTAQEQYNFTEHISIDEAVPGDLIFFTKTYFSGTFITHVAIFTGNNQIYEAGDPIGYSSMGTNWFKEHVVCAGRIKIR